MAPIPRSLPAPPHRLPASDRQTFADTFTATAHQHGHPAATLTDNGNVYTTKYAGGARDHGTANAFKPWVLQFVDDFEPVGEAISRTVSADERR